MSDAGRTNERAVPHDRADGPDELVTPAVTRAAASRPLLDDVDGLLDEIDQVLEVNAEEFVRGYVQKGGQ